MVDFPRGAAVMLGLGVRGREPEDDAVRSKRCHPAVLCTRTSVIPSYLLLPRLEFSCRVAVSSEKLFSCSSRPLCRVATKPKLHSAACSARSVCFAMFPEETTIHM